MAYVSKLLGVLAHDSGMIVVFGVKPRTRKTGLLGFLITLWVFWRDEKLSWLLKTSAVQRNCFCPNYLGFLSMKELESTGGRHNIFLAYKALHLCPKTNLTPRGPNSGTTKEPIETL